MDPLMIANLPQQAKSLMSPIDGPEQQLMAEVPPKPDFLNVGDEVVFRYQSIHFFAKD